MQPRQSQPRSLTDGAVRDQQNVILDIQKFPSVIRMQSDLVRVQIDGQEPLCPFMDDRHVDGTAISREHAVGPASTQVGIKTIQDHVIGKTVWPRRGLTVVDENLVLCVVIEPKRSYHQSSGDLIGPWHYNWIRAASQIIL